MDAVTKGGAAGAAGVSSAEPVSENSRKVSWVTQTGLILCPAVLAMTPAGNGTSPPGNASETTKRGCPPLASPSQSPNSSGVRMSDSAQHNAPHSVLECQGVTHGDRGRSRSL